MEDKFEFLEEIEKQLEGISASIKKVSKGHDESLDSKIFVEVKNDGMEAYLTITHPKLRGKPPSLKDVFDKVKREGISKFDEAIVLEALEKRLFGEPLLIAKGIPPTKGKDGELEIKIKDGEKVRKGDIIAIKRPPTKGTPGVDVFGREIPGLFGKDVSVITGEGVELEGSEIYALKDGEVRWSGNKVEVVEKKEEALRMSEEEIISLESSLEKEKLSIDGKVDVIVDKGGLSASIVVSPPRFNGKPVDFRAVMEALSKKGIIGVDQEAVRKVLRDGIFERPVVVAQGIPPIKGKDAYLANKVKSGEEVLPEQLLAVKVPPTEGRIGRTVDGRAIQAPPGKDIELQAGENVAISKDGMRAYATEYGEVRWEGNRVSVKGTYPKGILAEEEEFERLEQELGKLGKSLEEMAGKRSNLDGKVDVILKNEKTEAYIKLSPPKIGGVPLQFEDITRTLRGMGIVEFDKERVERAFRKREFNKEILVARGTLPTTGEDASIVYRFGLSAEGKNLYREVLPGQLLLFKVNPTPGKPGKTVTGEEIPGRLGKDMSIALGRGVVATEDGERIYAARKGRVIWEKNTIQVEELKEVEGDLTEDIDFSGRVIIHGSVRDGVLVKSTSDIAVEGRVGDATLISGGNISIKGAVYGKREGKIIAKGDVVATSCEGITIDVEGNVIVDGGIKRSTVKAKKKVISLGKKGQIEDGKITAGEAIAAKILGSEVKTKTELNVGREGRICCEETIHPGVILNIGGSPLQIKRSKRRVRFRLDGSKVKEEPYLEEKVERTTLRAKEEGVKVEDLVPFVVIRTSPQKVKEKGAKLLGFPEEKVEVKETLYKGKKEFLVFPKDKKGIWIKEMITPSSPVDGSYRLTNKEDGLFLTVFPPEGGGIPVDLQKVLKEIEERNFVDIDEEVVKRCVNEASSKPTKIGPRQRNPAVDGAAFIEITDDGKQAILTIIPPQPGGLEVTYEDVIKALRARRIVAGIKEEEIRDAISKRKYTTPIVVAEEIPPQPGKVSEIKYHFELHPSKRPYKDEEERVDFKELNIIQNVKAGQVLASRVPSTDQGKPGRRITGEEIPPPRLDEEKFPAGKNTVVSENGLELRATIDGHVVFVNERINVEPIYEIKGNVDISTGNIDFLGTVDISGDVEDGFRVRAEGDIQVRGGVGKATLSAGGSINVMQGIQSNYEGRVWAGGEITCKFVENAELFARGDITVYEEILHSELNTGGSLRVIGKRGLIVGGRIRAKDEVTARIIGCEIATPTLIEVGIPPKIREQISNLMDIINEEVAELERVKIEIKGLRYRKEKGSFGPEKEERLSQLLHTQHFLTRRLHSLVERKEMLERDFLRCKGGRVNVTGTVYPGVKIIIRDAEFEVKEPIQEVTFFYEGGEIRQKPYSSAQETFR